MSWFGILLWIIPFLVLYFVVRFAISTSGLQRTVDELQQELRTMRREMKDMIILIEKQRANK
jgi:hypothetical protein